MRQSKSVTVAREMLWLLRDFGTVIALALVFVAALVLTGCQTAVDVKGGQTHEVNVHHDPQRTDIYIHRDRKRRPNPPAP